MYHARPRGKSEVHPRSDAPLPKLSLTPTTPAPLYSQSAQALDRKFENTIVDFFMEGRTRDNQSVVAGRKSVSLVDVGRKSVK